MNETDRFLGLFTCGNCQSPTAIEMEFNERAKSFVPPDRRAQFIQRLEVINAASPKRRAVGVTVAAHPVDLNGVCEVVEAWPASTLAVPADLPPEIDRVWREDLVGQTSARGRALFSRAVLEHMVEARGAAGKNLKGKIDDLVTKNTLTADMAQWAHEIRLIGNLSAHEITPVDTDEANELYDFTVMLAEILFSYPARIERLRRRRNPEA